MTSLWYHYDICTFSSVSQKWVRRCYGDINRFSQCIFNKSLVNKQLLICINYLVFTLFLPPINPTALNLTKWENDLVTDYKVIQYNSNIYNLLTNTWVAKSLVGKIIRALGRRSLVITPWDSSSSFKRLINGAM